MATSTTAEVYTTYSTSRSKHLGPELGHFGFVWMIKAEYVAEFRDGHTASLTDQTKSVARARLVRQRKE